MLKDNVDPVRWEKMVVSRIVPWEVRRLQKSAVLPPTPWARMVVALSRTHGAGGDVVAAALGQIMAWPVYDRQLVDFIAENAHVRERVVASHDEKKQNEIENWIQTILDGGAIGNDKYFKHLFRVITAIMEHGQAIIIGRGAHYLVQPAHSLRVLVTAPLAWRAQQLAGKRGVLQREAEQIITSVDKNRLAFIKRFFHRDANDVTAFDLVLNREHISHEQAAQIILRVLEERVGSAFQPAPGPTTAVTATSLKSNRH